MLDNLWRRLCNPGYTYHLQEKIAQARLRTKGQVTVPNGSYIYWRNNYYKKAGFNGWWFICLLGIGAVVLGYLGLRNPIATGKTISVLIGLAIILGGCARIIGLIGINKFEKFLKGV